MTEAVVRKQEIFTKAVGYIASQLTPSRTAQPSRSILYGPDGRPLMPSASYGYRRTAAKKVGTLKNWIPFRYYTYDEEARERLTIVERSIDLVNNDPHAAGIVDSFATTVIGSGLVPHPSLNPDILGFTKDEIRAIQAQQRDIYQEWALFADAGQRLSFGVIQYLVHRSLMEYGEYLVLLPMLTDKTRPYSLACQIINPLRLKTPTDLTANRSIIDGVEIGSYGEPVAYWIQKSMRELGRPSSMACSSGDFIRVVAKKGHRFNVLHGFVQIEPEQYRGMPFFAPAMKFFRDLNDYLDAELVSNIVTAAFSLFIEAQSGQDPFFNANNLMSLSGEAPDATDQVKYQEINPGMVMYGNPGEKPHPIEASRPGATFDPFTKIIKKAISLSLNIPYPVLFKDVEATNFAGFRSAMLDAWRVFMMRRTWQGQSFNQPIWRMLMEEAYLRGTLKVSNFYSNMYALTQAEWRGSPKGDIEPIKAVQADVIAIQNNLKTRAEAIAERSGGDIRSTFDQLQEEQEMMKERGLTESPLVAPPPEKDDPDGDKMVDDMQNAGGGLEQS